MRLVTGDPIRVRSRQTLFVLGLVRHLTEMERVYFTFCIGGGMAARA